MATYHLYEADFVHKKLLKYVDEKDTLEEARKVAKELAKAWCVDEEPEKWAWNDCGITNEFWAGHADFGILIVYVTIGRQENI